MLALLIEIRPFYLCSVYRQIRKRDRIYLMKNSNIVSYKTSEVFQALLIMAKKQLTYLHIHCTVTDREIDLARYDNGLRNEILKNKAASRHVPETQPGDAIVFEDSFLVRYCLLGLPETSSHSVFLIGPFSSGQITRQDILNLCGTYQLSARKCQLAEAYYEQLPVLSETEYLTALLSALRDSFFPDRSDSPVTYLLADNFDKFTDPTVISASAFEAEFQSDTADTIARRYKSENALLDFIREGNVKGLTAALESHTGTILSDRNALKVRNSDPIRNFKNYMIIENSLCRKAAEEGHVHPYYINRVSSAFAKRIEIMQSIHELQSLKSEMARRYAMLVANYDRASLPEPVQRALVYIDEDLTADLSVKALARRINVHPNYLSSLFSRCLGTPLSAYVQKRRITHAVQLLNTTQMPISLIASYVGIDDANFFTKVFKKHIGLTPSQYRHMMWKSPKSKRSPDS